MLDAYTWHLGAAFGWITAFVVGWAILLSSVVVASWILSHQDRRKK